MMGASTNILTGLKLRRLNLVAIFRWAVIDGRLRCSSQDSYSYQALMFISYVIYSRSGHLGPWNTDFSYFREFEHSAWQQ